VKFNTLNGSRYVVETGTVATRNGPWAPLTSVLNGTGAPIQINHSPTNSPQFYRVRLLRPDE
jgi:hypothetical protein